MLIGRSADGAAPLEGFFGLNNDLIHLKTIHSAHVQIYAYSNDAQRRFA